MQKLFRNLAILVISIFATSTLTGCSNASSESNEITVVVHDSVIISDALLAEFKTQTGLAVKIIRAGDAGAMTNKLVLTKDQPIAPTIKVGILPHLRDILENNQAPAMATY